MDAFRKAKTLNETENMTIRLLTSVAVNKREYGLHRIQQYLSFRKQREDRRKLLATYPEGV